MRRKKLRKNETISKSENVNEIELEEVYDDIENENDRIYYLRMNYKLDNYEIGVYDQINYDQLNVETNQTLEYLEILE
jgi:hypothetical protein